MARVASGLPPERRSSLRGRSAFQRVYRSGRRHRVGGILMISSPSPTPTGSVAFVAGRKVGGAVHRNRAKRRMRAASIGVSFPSGSDVILIASPAVNSASFAELTAWIREAADHARR